MCTVVFVSTVHSDWKGRAKEQKQRLPLGRTALGSSAQIWAKSSQGARQVASSVLVIIIALRVRRGQQVAILQYGKRQETHFSRDPEVAICVSFYPGRKHFALLTWEQGYKNTSGGKKLEAFLPEFVTQ